MEANYQNTHDDQYYHNHYCEPIQNQIHNNYDKLLIAFSDNNLYKHNYPNQNFESTGSGYSLTSISSLSAPISAIVAGDFKGDIVGGIGSTYMCVNSVHTTVAASDPQKPKIEDTFNPTHFVDRHNPDLDTYQVRNSNGDGKDELFFIAGTNTYDAEYYAENVPSGKSAFNSITHSTTSSINSTTSTITHLAKGDLDNDGDDEIVYAVSNPTNGFSIHISDSTDINTTSYNLDSKLSIFAQNCIPGNSTYQVTAITCGDFEGTGRDNIIVALKNTTTNKTLIYILTVIDPRSNYYLSKLLYDGTSQLLADGISEYQVSAMTAGRFSTTTSSLKYRDRLVVAFTNATHTCNKTYLFAIPENFTLDDKITTNPILLSEGTLIGDNSNYYITALNAGKFNVLSNTITHLAMAITNSAKTVCGAYIVSNSIDEDFSQVNIFNDSRRICIYWKGSTIAIPYITAMASGYFEETVKSGEEGNNILSKSTSNYNNNGNNPKEFSLSIYPNPFNPSTQVEYYLNSAEKVSIAIYNTLGQKVIDIEQGIQEKGIHKINIDGQKMASGVYFCRIQSGNNSAIKKMMLLK